MQHKENENLEDFVLRFLYNLQNTKQAGMNEETTKNIFLREIRDGYVDILNLMGSEDVSQLPL